MTHFTAKDVADYYDQTESHYKFWWKFEESLGLHYGIWNKETKSLRQAILNTNIILAEMGGLTTAHNVLDAGCGIGGTSIFFAKNYGCRVTGITISHKQAANAARFAGKNGVSEKATFQQMDYTATSFPDNTFDVVVAVESMQSAEDKSIFLNEMKRVLKPGGKFIVVDLFNTSDTVIEEQKYVKTMFYGWAISEVLSTKKFIELADKSGFSIAEHRDVTKEVFPSVLRLFLIAFVGMWGSKLYELFVKKTSAFARNHYKTYFAQYFAYKCKLWKYEIIAFKNKK